MTTREIVIDTETTGLDPLNADRVVEIGAVELIDRSPTGRTFHRYVCPERAVPADALAVHGLTAEFLADKPLFGAVADEFLAFVGDAPLVAHNAGFDIAFLNAELTRVAKPPIAAERVIDTLVLAPRKHPGGHNTLDGHTLDVVVGGSNPTEFFHHVLGFDLSGNSTLALVMRSAIISVLEENFGSVQMFGHRLAFLRHCHNRWPNDRTLKAEYNKHMAQRNIN
jgi:DNA polymerase III epsilon subunit-like protein